MIYNSSSFLVSHYPTDGGAIRKNTGMYSNSIKSFSSLQNILGWFRSRYTGHSLSQVNEWGNDSL